MNETRPATSPTHSQISHEEISRRAQDLWEKYGRPAGRDEEIWFEAERILRAEQSAPSAPSSAVSSSPVTPSPIGAGSPAADPAHAARPSGGTATPRMPGARSRKR